LDPKRTARMASFGGILDAPILHFWYHQLDRRIPATTTVAVAQKLFLDQTICAPVVYAMFFPWLGMLMGHSREKITERIKKDFVSTYVMDCAIWVPANWINFKYVPSSYRVGYVGMVSFVWAVYLAFVGGHD